jgi:hypothetical protein
VKYCLITLRWDFNEDSIVWSNGHHWSEVVRPVDVDFLFVSLLLFFFLILLRILNHKKISSTPPVKIKLSGQYFIILISLYDSTRFIINLKMWGNDITRTCFYTANTQTWTRLLICRNRWFSGFKFCYHSLNIIIWRQKICRFIIYSILFLKSSFYSNLVFPFKWFYAW